VTIGGVPRAYPWPVLAGTRVVHDSLGGEQIVVIYQPGTLSALDHSSMERSRAVGATGVFSALVGGQPRTFEPVADGFRDRESGTIWNLLVTTRGE
jgi:hypothetical protein